jgi:hypothetical protein
MKVLKKLAFKYIGKEIDEQINLRVNELTTINGQTLNECTNLKNKLEEKEKELCVVKAEIDKEHIKNEDIRKLILAPTRLTRPRKFDIIEENNKWVAYMGFCKLGGCYMDGVVFESQESANLAVAILGILGEKPSLSVCQECYSEYINGCI